MERVRSKHLFNYRLRGELNDEIAAELKMKMEAMDINDPATAALLNPAGLGPQEFVALMRPVVVKMFAPFEQHPVLVKAVESCAHTKLEVPPRDGNDYAVPVFVHTPKFLEGQTGKVGNACVIYAHGGGAIAGTAETFRSWLSHTAVNCGVVYFNVDYRLAPETKCPKNALDFYCAVKHVIENASELGIDADRIAIAGDSGGGYIVMVTMVMLAQKNEGHLIKLAIPGIPMLDDYAFGDPNSMTKEERGNAPGMKKVWECLATNLEEQRKNSDPLLFPAKASDDLLAKMPPTIIWEAEFDFFITEAIRMAKRLQAAGRLLELYVAPGLTHGGAVNPDFRVFQRNAEDYKLALEAYLL